MFSLSEHKSDDTTPNAVIPNHAAKRSSNFPASTSKILSMKEIKKLRQKTKKTLLSLQTTAADDNVEKDDTLNNPVDIFFKADQHLINSDTMKHPTCIEPPLNGWV